MDDTRRKAIETAGAQLRHDEDTHWTKGGKPDLNALREFVGSYVSREEAETALPGLIRRAANDATPEAPAVPRRIRWVR